MVASEYLAWIRTVETGKVFCGMRQMCTWDGRTHQEIIDTPVPVLGGRVEALERRLDEIEQRLGADLLSVVDRTAPARQ